MYDSSMFLPKKSEPRKMSFGADKRSYTKALPKAMQVGPLPETQGKGRFFTNTQIYGYEKHGNTNNNHS